MGRWNGWRMVVRMLCMASLCVLTGSGQPSYAYLSEIPATFSGDGRLLLIQMNELVLWDLEAKTLVAKIPDLQCREFLLLRQDGWFLCVGNGLTIYDWKNKATVWVMPPEGTNEFGLLAYSREMDRLVVRHGNEAVSVWQVGKKLVPLKHITLDARKEISSLAASPDTKTLAVAGGHTIQFHDLISTGVRDVAIPEGKPRHLLFAPNSMMVAASIGDTVVFVDSAKLTVRARATLGAGEEGKRHIIPRRFSEDSLRLLASHKDWSYPLFEVDTGKLVALTEVTYTDQERGVPIRTPFQAVDISDDAEYVVGQSGYPSTVQMWDVHTGSRLPELCGDECRATAPGVLLLKWSPNGSKLVVAMQGGPTPELDGKISVWDVPSRSPELVLDPSSPTAKVLAKRTSAPPPVTMAAPAKPVPVSQPPVEPAFAHARAFPAVTVSPTDNVLVTSGEDGFLKVWDPGGGKLLRQLVLPTTVTALAFSADGGVLAAGTAKGEVRLWETQTWKEFPSYTGRPGQINALQFLQDGQAIVIAGEYPDVQVVNLAIRQVVRQLVPSGQSAGCEKKGCAAAQMKQAEPVEQLSLVDGSPFLLTTSRTSRVVWDITTWQEVEKPAGLPETWSGLGWHRPFVSTITRPKDQHQSTLAIWDTKHNKLLASFETFTKKDTELRDGGPSVALGTAVAIDPGQQWAATRVGESVSVWSLATHAKKKTFLLKLPYHLHWTSDGKHLIITTHDRKILVWSTETMEPAHYLRDPTVTR